MALIIANHRFSPGLFTSALTLLCLLAFIRLGMWQLDRAEYKREMYQVFVEQQQSASVPLDALDFTAEQSLYWKPVTVSGRFNENLQLLLDNRTYKGQQGYYVYGVFKPDNLESWLLVNQGWLKANPDRSMVPDLLRDNERVTLNGKLKRVPNTGILLAEVSPEKMQAYVYRFQKLNIAEIESLIQHDLLPFVMQLDQSSATGYVRDWTEPGSDEQKHLGYAFQFFAFALTLLTGYCVMNFKKID